MTDPAFDLAAVEQRISTLIADEQATQIVLRFFAELQTRTARRLADGSVFLVTGDIPAMWLRDSAAQLMPLLRVGAGPQAEEFAIAVFRRQLEYVLLDPYANAFNPEPNGAGHGKDVAEVQCSAWVWERKYEVDSLCYPLLLAYRIWRGYGRADIFDTRFWQAVGQILELWETEQDHENKSRYRFRRRRVLRHSTLTRGGRGPEVAVTGMTWSGFRPSDDATRYGYNVPGNQFASLVLGRISEIAEAHTAPDPDQIARAKRLRAEIDAGIRAHAVIDDPDTGPRWAYEVDGRGGVLEMDDANIPSLLALPLIGYCRADDPVYRATRAFVLSERNPYFYRGSAASGVGSPHTPRRHVWPIAIATAGLTSTEPADKRAAIDTLLATHVGTTRIHESFHVDRPTSWTRGWFSWAEAMFSELVLDYCGYRHPDVEPA
ncbi:glycoside hydrolase family 125 protein [Actinocrinis sp.]|uniref:glycoside hydrolase family 125 protein n=1 Tax=Actinocrinis sp. TaxID=1920516 RepID=UPI002D6113B1|nr:glycoside hydrolase family 125 protein [Actinocrinis sp.]HZP51418.1 glycoside hydrolase family 125 protein [Actinocrinis sp.]